jgi:hypothetical protein
VTRDTHRCRDTSLRRLQALREAGYLRLPPQQLQITKANFNPYVYDLTDFGWAVLSERQDLERHCRPTGHWWHSYWVSAVSSAIEITAKRSGLDYIAAAEILAIKRVQLGIPMGSSKLIPDQLFAIRYHEGYRAFALELDRGTEPMRSAAARKSCKSSVDQYRHFFAERQFQKHYGLKSNVSVLWVLNSIARRNQIKSIIGCNDLRFATAFTQCFFPNWKQFQLLGRDLNVFT